MIKLAPAPFGGLSTSRSPGTISAVSNGSAPQPAEDSHQDRTGPDPLAAIWPESEGFLVRARGLAATTICETLQGRPEIRVADGQLCTVPRRIRRGRTPHGPDREVMFPQHHRPGEYAQSEFTYMGSRGITLNGQPFDHRFSRVVLPYSNWETGMICLPERFEGVIAGLQAAGWELGRAPAIHRTYNLSAAPHDLREGRRSKGGLTTNIHTAAEGLGNPLRFILTSGQASAYTQAEPELAGFPAQYVIADKGYDSKTIVEAVDRSGAKVVIPSRTCGNEPFDTDFAPYAERDRIECFFNRLTHYRAIETRYAKCARNFASPIYIAATMLWMK